MLTNIGFIVLGFILGFLFVSGILTLGIYDKRILILFSGELKKYEVVVGVVGSRGKPLWKRPTIKSPGDAFVWSIDIDLDEWK